jgi:hypothetical protein
MNNFAKDIDVRVFVWNLFLSLGVEVGVMWGFCEEVPGCLPSPLHSHHNVREGTDSSTSCYHL